MKKFQGCGSIFCFAVVNVCATFTWGKFSRLPFVSGLAFFGGLLGRLQRLSLSMLLTLASSRSVPHIRFLELAPCLPVSGGFSSSICFSTSPCRFINSPPPVESSSAPLVAVPTPPPVSPSYGWSCGLCPRIRTSYCSYSCARLRQLTTWSSALVSTSNAAVASIRRHF